MTRSTAWIDRRRESLARLERPAGGGLLRSLRALGRHKIQKGGGELGDEGRVDLLKPSLEND